MIATTGVTMRIGRCQVGSAQEAAILAGACVGYYVAALALLAAFWAIVALSVALVWPFIHGVASRIPRP